MKHLALFPLWAVWAGIFFIYACGPLERMDPPCPIVDSLSPKGAKAGDTITVTGRNFLSMCPNLHTVKIGQMMIPQENVIEIPNERTLKFIVPEGAGNGTVSVNLLTAYGCEEPANGPVLTRHLTAASPIIFAGEQGNSGCSNCFDHPLGIAADVSGNLYVADRGHQVIKKVGSSGNSDVQILAGLLGQGSFADGPKTIAKFKDPSDVTIDAAGNVFVADKTNHCIRKIVAGVNNVVTVCGNYMVSADSADCLLSQARFKKPTGISNDNNGNLFVSDYESCRLTMVSSANNRVSTLAGNGTPSENALKFPGGVEYTDTRAGSYQVFIADWGNGKVRGASLNFDPIIIIPDIPLSPFTNPIDVAADETGNLFVLDQSKKQVFVIYPDNTVAAIAGKDILSPPGIIFDKPAGIAYDKKNKYLYVSDENLGLIVRYSIK